MNLISILLCVLLIGGLGLWSVSRIGGDEFVALLKGADYQDREVLIAEMNAAIEKSLAAEKPWQRLCIAKGLAVLEPGDGSLDAVFNRADGRMYADKRRMKGLE